MSCRQRHACFCSLAALLLLLTLAVVAPARSNAQNPVPKPSPEVQALLDKANQARAASRSEEALRLYTEALEKSRTLHDTAGEASTLFSIGSVYHVTGQPQKALESYQQALPLFRQAGDKAGEASTLTNIGLVFRATGQPQKALELLQQTVPLRRQTGDKVGEANALNNIGNVYLATGQPQQALDFFEQALPVFRQTGYKLGEANTLHNIGLVYRATGQPQKALEFFEQALPLYKQVRNTGGEASTLSGIGNAYHATGQPQKALESYQQVLPLYKQLGNKGGEAGTLTNIGLVYRATGQPQKALEWYQQALLLHRQIGYKAGEASALTNIGLVYRDIGRPQKALEFFEQALPLHRQLGDTAGEASTLSGIGNVYDTTGQPQKALGLYQQVLSLRRQTGHKSGEAGALANIGLVYRATDQPQKALAFFEQALPVFRQTGDKVNEAYTLYSIAGVQAQRGRLPDAERHLRDAVALLESIRADLGGLSEAKVGFLTSKLGTYYRYIQVLLQQGKPTEAFAVVQKTKARALLDLMASGRVDIGRQLTGVEKQQEQELRGRADQLNVQMIKEGVQNEVGAKKRFAALKVQLAQAESELQKFTDGLYARHPDLARKRAAKTVNLADVARFLPADTALLEYVALAAGTGTEKDAIDQTVLLVVTKEAGKATVRTYSLPVTREALTKKTDALRLACADPRKPYQNVARQMYRLLLPPAAAKQLVGKKRLVICPDGPLWDVPFAALHDGKRFLLQRYEVAYAYSATGAQAALVARAAGRTRPTGTLLALANPLFDEGKRFGDSGIPGERPITTPDRPLTTPDRPLTTPDRPLATPDRPIASPDRPIASPDRPLPSPDRPLPSPDRPLPSPDRDVLLPRGGRLVDLPGTQREADALKSDFPDAAVYTRRQAQETIIKQKAGGYRYLHLASHAFFNDAAPLLSSVVLAQPPPGSADDGFLTAREIFDLTLSADMVVLSACNTARGEKKSGEGIVGLTWALFVAGAPTQVLSQWAVNDASTATLMERFYRKVAKSEAKGASLRSAALSLLKDKKHAHPYYWAPFILVGNWR